MIVTKADAQYILSALMIPTLLGFYYLALGL
jgi:hypothetical protein